MSAAAVAAAAALPPTALPSDGEDRIRVACRVKPREPGTSAAKVCTSVGGDQRTVSWAGNRADGETARRFMSAAALPPTALPSDGEDRIRVACRVKPREPGTSAAKVCTSVGGDQRTVSWAGNRADGETARRFMSAAALPPTALPSDGEDRIRVACRVKPREPGTSAAKVCTSVGGDQRTVSWAGNRADGETARRFMSAAALPPTALPSDGEDRIRVACRVKPREPGTSAAKVCTSVGGDQRTVSWAGNRADGETARRFMFDYAAGEGVGQEELFQKVTPSERRGKCIFALAGLCLVVG